MNRIILPAIAALSLLVAGAARAADEYNTVPAGDAQFAQCRAYGLKQYEGGEEKSPIPKQSKVDAWCTCMWNETPDDFKGNLAKFSETPKGAATNKTCEKYADWGN